MAKVGVIGAGSWGIALAKLLRTNGNEVTVWSIVEEEVAMLRSCLLYTSPSPRDA